MFQVKICWKMCRNIFAPKKFVERKNQPNFLLYSPVPIFQFNFKKIFEVKDFLKLNSLEVLNENHTIWSKNLAYDSKNLLQTHL